MPRTPQPATARADRTFAVGMGVLGVTALGLAGAAAFALVRRLDPPPPRVDGGAALAGGVEADAARGPAPAPEAPAPTPVPISPPPVAAPARDPLGPAAPPPPSTAINDPRVAELVELAVLLRREGDMGGALQKLRQADRLHGGHPRILWELAGVYEKLSIPDKAESSLRAILQLGPGLGGEYHVLAQHTLASLRAPGASQRDAASALRFGDPLTTPDTDPADGQQVGVRLALHSSLATPIDPADVAILIQFYDLVDGATVEPSRGDPPLNAWPTQPVDFATGSEIVDYTYRMPLLSPGEIAAVGQREFYGFVAKLYYRDALQDVLAQPRTLLADPPRGGPANPMLDPSLFPTP